MKKDNIQQLNLLTESFSKQKIKTIQALPGSGSYRQYYRIHFDNSDSIIGVYNADVKENIAFLEFSKTFFMHGVAVPEVYAVSDDQQYYLLSDLGDVTLFQYLNESEQNEDKSRMVKSALTDLIKIQTTAGAHIDYNLCYPRPAFDKQSMLWDLWYFKYYFLKVMQVGFDEQELENDFHTFTDYLLSAETDFFLFRDFQTRNIMVKDNKPYFIDYQGGRKGALQYDLASILFDAKADFSEEQREEFYQHYLSKLSSERTVDQQKFREYYHAYALIRILQAMGAYGFRGLVEQKPHFILSIPYGIKNLEWLLSNHQIPIELPSLFPALKELVNINPIKKFEAKKDELVLSINSFSFKKGIPIDESGNGGGFVFDCRGMNNPGRIEEYKKSTGLDKNVQDFLSNQKETIAFIKSAYDLIDLTIQDYKKNKRQHLMINFGCTGGQHRSVFCSQSIGEQLMKIEGVDVRIRHREIEKGLF